MKNHDLFSLERALKEITSERLKATSAYKLLAILKAVRRETETIREAMPGYIDFESKAQQAGADLKELTKEYEIDIKQASELLGADFTGELKKIKLSELQTATGEELSITVQQAAALEPIIDEG